MKDTSHLFFVIFYAIIIAIGLMLRAIGGETSYESTFPEYSAWALLLLSLAIWLSEKYKKIYLCFILAGLFILTTSSLQALVFFEAQELWYKVFRALVIPFSIYIYVNMFLYEKWALLKQHNKSFKL